MILLHCSQRLQNGVREVAACIGIIIIWLGYFAAALLKQLCLLQFINIMHAYHTHLFTAWHAKFYTLDRYFGEVILPNCLYRLVAERMGFTLHPKVQEVNVFSMNVWTERFVVLMGERKQGHPKWNGTHILSYDPLTRWFYCPTSWRFGFRSHIRIDFLFSFMFYSSCYDLFPFVFFFLLCFLFPVTFCFSVLNGNQNPKWKIRVNCLSHN